MHPQPFHGRTALEKPAKFNDCVSSMKYDAIVEQGIPILERIPIPDELIPEDSRVEIDASKCLRADAFRMSQKRQRVDRMPCISNANFFR